MQKNGGFTLVELLLYVGIFSILAVVFSSVLVTVTKVNVGQIAKNEVANQMNFVLQKIQQSVSEGSLIVVRSDEPSDLVNPQTGSWDEEDSNAAGDPKCTDCKYLIIHPKDEGNGATDTRGPIIIYRDEAADPDEIVVRKGYGAGAQVVEKLSTPQVSVAGLKFTKYSNQPGRDLVEINLTMSYVSSQPQQQVTRNAVLGVSKAVAAVFDTALIPGPSGLDFGGTAANDKWANGYFAGTLQVDTQAKVDQLVVGIDDSGNAEGDAITRINYGNLSMPAFTATANAVTQVTVTPPANSGGKFFLTPPTGFHDDLVYVGANLSGGNLIVAVRNLSVTDVNEPARSWHYFSLQP